MTSIIKVDDVQNQPGTNIISKCGTDVTLGASGDTVALASGASQTGFGRTGTVDWVTTPKVTGDSPVTGVSGSGYFMNTTAGAITLNLPAGAAGSIVSVADYAATWQTNSLTVSPNGSEKIGGAASGVVLNTEGQSVTFVYVDSTQGWLNTMDSTSNVRGSAYPSATGGTITCCGDYKIHTFTGPGTFCVSSVPCAPKAVVDYLVVGGGGGGGAKTCHNGPGSGGAGGFRASATTYTNAGPSSPLTPTCGPTAVAALAITAQPYSIVVGSGGAGGLSPAPPGTSASAPGTIGVASSFSTIPSAGGGFGAGAGDPTGSGDGGSGGGGPGNVDYQPAPAAAGAGNTPPVSPPQGNPGGGVADNGGGGGGGALAAGTVGASNAGGPGGAGGGVPNAFGTSGENCGSYYYFSGGGGGGSMNPSYPPGCGVGGNGGLGGGGAASTPSLIGSGTANTGGGGGGGRGQPNPPLNDRTAGTGGSGIVIIRYKYQ